MKFCSSIYNVGYPVYGAKFLNNSMLLVAGGGGEGNNGIPNKLTVLRVDFDKKKVVKRFREITLDANDDSPTTLDVASDIILLGCNENTEKIKSGRGNQHLRKFIYENEHLRFVASVDLDGSKIPEDYTKLVYLSKDGTVGAVASSRVPAVIRIIDPRDLTEKYEIETGHDVKDMHFAPDGKVIGYITATTLEVISIVTGRFIIRKTDFEKNLVLSKLRFLTDNTIIIAASLKKGSGIVMVKISLKSGSATVIKSKLLTNKFKGVTSMDVDAKNELAVLAGNENSIAMVKLKDLSLGKLFKQVHSFAITRVTFSPDSQLVASVSAANTVHIIKIPSNFALSTSIWKKLWKFFINFVLIVLVGIFGHYFYKYDMHTKSIRFLKEQYIARRNRNSTVNDIFRQTTLVGDVLSTPVMESFEIVSAGSISTGISGSSYTVDGEGMAYGASATESTITNNKLPSLTSFSTFSTPFASESADSTGCSFYHSDLTVSERPTTTQNNKVQSSSSYSNLESEMRTFSISNAIDFTASNPLPNTDSTSIFQSIAEKSVIVASQGSTKQSEIKSRPVTAAMDEIKSATRLLVNEKTEEIQNSTPHSFFFTDSVESASEELILTDRVSETVGESSSTVFQASGVTDKIISRTTASEDQKELSNTRIRGSDPELSHTEDAGSSIEHGSPLSISSSVTQDSSLSLNAVSSIVEEPASSIYAANKPVEESMPVPTASLSHEKENSLESFSAESSEYISIETLFSQGASETKEKTNTMPSKSDLERATPSEIKTTSASIEEFVLEKGALTSKEVQKSSSKPISIKHSVISAEQSGTTTATEIPTSITAIPTIPDLIQSEMSTDQSLKIEPDTYVIDLLSDPLLDSETASKESSHISFQSTPTEGILSNPTELSQETIPDNMSPSETTIRSTYQSEEGHSNKPSLLNTLEPPSDISEEHLNIAASNTEPTVATLAGATSSASLDPSEPKQHYDQDLFSSEVNLVALSSSFITSSSNDKSFVTPGSASMVNYDMTSSTESEEALMPKIAGKTSQEMIRDEL